MCTATLAKAECTATVVHLDDSKSKLTKTAELVPSDSCHSKPH